MKRRTLTNLILTAAVAMAVAPSTAQTARQQLRPAVSNSIVSLMEDAAVVNPLSMQQPTFGQRLVQRLKEEGRRLPLPEEKMLRLKPGHRNYVRQLAPGEKPLSFSGMLQYNEYEGRMLLEYGFYKFSETNGFVREKMADVDFCLNGRGAYYNHKLHGTGSVDLPFTGKGDWTYCEWDTDTWEPTGNHGSRLNVANLIMKAADWDPTTGICYGWKQESGGSAAFVKVDYENQSREIITASDSLVVMLAVNSQGQMYGVTENGSFCSIDKESGRLTYIGSLDFTFYPVLESMTFDRRTDRLYMVASEVDEETEEMFGRLCEVDVATGRTSLIAYLPEAEEYTCLHVLYEPDGGAPADLNDLNANFASEGTAGIVNFTLPTTTIDGRELTGNVSYRITLNDDEATATTGEAAPGTWKAAVLTPKGEGRQKVVVELTSADGLTGHRNWVKTWIGEDTPKPHNVVMTVDEATMQTSVEWQAERGVNDGYTDPKDLTFDVYRYPGGTKVAAGISQTSFSESLSGMSYNGYYYKVVAKRGETEGLSEVSNVCHVGLPYEVPFTDDFEDADCGGKYAVIDSNADGTTWDFINFGSTTGRMRYSYDKHHAADDWCLTPPIHLMEGVAYEISFDAFSVSPYYKERIAVACGMGQDPAAYEVIIEPTVVSTTNIQTALPLSGEIKVKQTGDYRFGFHALSDVFQNALFIDNLQVTAGQLLTTPDSVKNLRLTAADDGDLVVTIDFDAPLKANDGTDLQSLSRIVITRGEQKDAVATLTDVAPGQHCTYVDEDAVNGSVVYDVTAYNEAGAGLTARQTVYVGTDAPHVPVAVALADNLNGSATLMWQAPLTGQHGGYVDPDELTYNVYGVVNNQLQKVKEEVGGTSYVVENIPQTGAQGQVIYGVSAVNELGESGVAVAAPLIVGAPYTLPFVEGFLTSGLKGIWATRANQSGVAWKMYSGMSSDGDDCVTAVESEQPGTVAVLTSGKISLAGATTPKLVFSAYGDPGTANILKVAIQKNGEAKADTVLAVDYASQTAEDFITYAVDLSAYKDSKYITAAFIAELNDPQLRMIVVDDVNFRQVNPCDVAAYADVQSRTTAGQKAHIGVTVHNVGEQEAKDYTVSIYVNGRAVKTFDEVQRVAPFGRALYETDYLTLPTDPEKSKVWAVVDYAADQAVADNTTVQHDLRIVQSQMEAVADLTAVANDDGTATLQWTPVSGQNSVTESFEGYESFQKQFGQWGNHDQDRCLTAGINGLWWPGANQPQAFLTFNFREAGVSEALMKEHPEFEANTGTQFVACFKANNAPGNKNNDWLVSPELSGDEQTVTIHAQSLAGYVNERFEVLYSTTGNKVSDFKADNLIDTYDAPKSYFGRFRVNLPAGAKYFAVHCISSNGGIFMVDDISFEGRQLTLKGYNVYCDGELVGTADASAHSFLHSTTALAAGLHTYHVTALYAEGESALSNAAPVAVVSGITTADGRRLSITTQPGCIVVNEAKGLKVAVYTLDGRTVFQGQGDAVVPVAAGQYVVVAGSTAANVVVK